MRGWGIMLLIFGIGSFILPLMGVQFRLMQLFGENTAVAGIGLAALGAVMVGASVFTGGDDD